MNDADGARTPGISPTEPITLRITEDNTSPLLWHLQQHSQTNLVSNYSGIPLERLLCLSRYQSQALLDYLLDQHTPNTKITLKDLKDYNALEKILNAEDPFKQT